MGACAVPPLVTPLFEAGVVVVPCFAEVAGVVVVGEVFAGPLIPGAGCCSHDAGDRPGDGFKSFDDLYASISSTPAGVLEISGRYQIAFGLELFPSFTTVFSRNARKDGSL